MTVTPLSHDGYDHTVTQLCSCAHAVGEGTEGGTENLADVFVGILQR